MAQNRRLIDADALCEYCSSHKMTEVFPDWNTLARSTQECVCKLGAKMKDIIKDAPTIEAEPVRHGQWIPDDYEYNHCSECGFEHDEPEYVTPYCPNCGANMDSED